VCQDLEGVESQLLFEQHVINYLVNAAFTQRSPRAMSESHQQVELLA
jgi:hypothetical protein